MGVKGYQLVTSMNNLLRFPWRWRLSYREEPGEVGRGRTETPLFSGPYYVHMNFVHLEDITSNFMNGNSTNLFFFSFQLESFGR